MDFREQSLLNWGNPARQQERGSVFAWLSDGRPRVIGSIFTYQLAEAVREKVEFHSLSEDPLVATCEGGAVLISPSGARDELRLMTQPLLRYGVHPR